MARTRYNTLGGNSVCNRIRVHCTTLVCYDRTIYKEGRPSLPFPTLTSQYMYTYNMESLDTIISKH